MTLHPDVDLSRKSANDTFQGSLAAPVALPGDSIPQGALVILICLPSTTRPGDASMTVHAYSVSAGGKIWQVSTSNGVTSDGAPASGVLRGNTILVFTVTSSRPPVTVKR